MSIGQDAAFAEIDAASHADFPHMFPVGETLHANELLADAAVEAILLAFDLGGSIRG
jgi:hypothetical protein